MGAVGIGNFFILLIMASNLGAAKSIAPYEATEPGMHGKVSVVAVICHLSPVSLCCRCTCCRG